MLIRPATLLDAPAIAAVHVASWREAYASLMPEKILQGLSAEDRTRRWGKILDPPSGGTASTSVFVADDQDRVVGFAACGPQRNEGLHARGFTGEISAIYVLAAAQNRGVGGQLMAEAARQLDQDRHRAAALWVLRDNGTARRFYENRAGRVLGEREDRRDGVVLVELVYGWSDLDALIARRETSSSPHQG